MIPDYSNICQKIHEELPDVQTDDKILNDVLKDLSFLNDDDIYQEDPSLGYTYTNNRLFEVPTGEISLDYKYKNDDRFIPYHNVSDDQTTGEFIGNYNSNAAYWKIDGEVFWDPPFYERVGDIDKSKSDKRVVDGFYYFVRPFPVEGVYVLEVYRRNDDCAEIDLDIEIASPDVEKGEESDTIKNYEADRKKILEDELDSGLTFEDYVRQIRKSATYFANILLEGGEGSDPSNKWTNKCLRDDYRQYNNAKSLRDSGDITEAEFKIAQEKWYNACENFRNKVTEFAKGTDDVPDITQRLNNSYNKFYSAMFKKSQDGSELIPSEDEDKVEQAKKTLEEEFASYNDPYAEFITYIQEVVNSESSEPLPQTDDTFENAMIALDSLAEMGPASTEMTNFTTSYMIVRCAYDDLEFLDYGYWKKYSSLFKNKQKLAIYKAIRKIYYETTNTVDKKMLACKLLNRNEKNPDKKGFYRIVKEVGAKKFQITTLNKSPNIFPFEITVDNTDMYSTWETPDKYMIKYTPKTEEDDAFYTVSCNKDGVFSDTNGILTYIYEGSGCSPILGDEFNYYGNSVCPCLTTFKTSLKYWSASKVYTTRTTSGRGKLIYEERFSIFDADKPFPIMDEFKKTQITQKTYEALKKLNQEDPKNKEYREYKKIGDPTMDEKIQQILKSLEQVKPLLTSLMPITSIMGTLEPLISTFQSVEKTLKTVNKTIGTLMKTIDKISSMPIVGVVASPLKGILDVVIKLTSSVVTFYMENYVLLKKIRTISEQMNTKNIKKQLEQFKKDVKQNLDEVKDNAKNAAESATDKKLKELDKKKMEEESPVKNDNEPTVQGTYASLLADFSLTCLLPDIPKELLEQIEKIEKTIDTLQGTIDKVDKLKDYGDKIDKAMVKISTVKAVLTATPPLALVNEQVRKASVAVIQDGLKKIKEFEEKQIQMELEAKRLKENSLKYEKTKQVNVAYEVPTVIGKKTIEARSNPEVKG